ncbi:transposase [Candidatus Thiomargarita nelsonii]|uniref:Transposase n=1 Tax=Candidatus Thiomargarita nelsonii TaxID=1003181 RepID=A0A4E0QRR5_9GAMM|nr:transposase [Candidatus Thiomargarita nelsonii]
MRIVKKSSTAICTFSTYISFLLSEPKNATCTRLSNILGISHDSINRFLQREDYNQKDLFDQVKSKIALEGGTLSVDDSVIDKPYSNPNKTELIDYFLSGKHKKTVKGINLVTLYYTDINQVCVPVNFRLVEKLSGKTKNDYFLDMLHEVLLWGLKPLGITGDSWYSSLNNLKFMKNHELSFMFAIKNNRLVSLEKGTYIQIQHLDIPNDAGLSVYLKGFGFVKIFKKIFKDEYRYYILHCPQTDELNRLVYDDFKRIHDKHWNIERFHRAVKQVCNIERFQVRTTEAIKNHVFCAICAFVKLELMRVQNQISNWYEIQKNLFNDVIRAFIQEDSINESYVT